MTGHTKEPWRANRHASMSIESAEGRGVCSTGGYADNFSNGAYHDENEANARRIVSCVNAMQGIPDPAAYVAAADQAVEWLRAISTWLLETDNDMKLPGGILDTDPLDLADALTAARAAKGGTDNG